MFGATVANTGSQRHLKFVKDTEQMMVNYYYYYFIFNAPRMKSYQP